MSEAHERLNAIVGAAIVAQIGEGIEAQRRADGLTSDLHRANDAIAELRREVEELKRARPEPTLLFTAMQRDGTIMGYFPTAELAEQNAREWKGGHVGRAPVILLGKPAVTFQPAGSPLPAGAIVHSFDGA